MGRDARDSPREGRDVAGRKAQLDDRAGEEIIAVPVDGLLLEVVLELPEGAYRMAGILHRGYECPVLDVFLDMGLDAAVSAADLSRKPAHALDVAAAEEEGYGHDHDHYGGETPVEVAEEEEGGGELDGSREQRRHRAGKGVGHTGDIAFQAVQHVARVQGLLARPPALHDLDEVAVPH